MVLSLLKKKKEIEKKEKERLIVVYKKTMQNAQLIIRIGLQLQVVLPGILIINYYIISSSKKGDITF